MSTYAVGIKVSEEQLHAVLVEQADDQLVLRAHFDRSIGEPDTEMDFTGGFAEEEDDFEDEDDDYTLQFGDDGGAGDLFLGSEFGDLEGDEETSRSFSATSFETELQSILMECADQGFDNPEVAFCTTSSEMDELELRIPPNEGTTGSEDETGLPLPVKRSTLLKMLEEQYEGGVEDERVGFVPMRPTGDGRHRVLALIAPPSGSVLTTLRSLKDGATGDLPAVRRFESEIPIYLGLARAALDLPSDATERSLVVRTGEDDTLVLFVEGRTLLQAESLPSLSARDPADTICSRVLLLQDEYGIGEVQHVLVVGGDGDDALKQGFKDFFPDATVAGLRSFLPVEGEVEPGAYVGALAAAVRQLGATELSASFQDLNFLPKSYTKTSFSLPVGWSVPALLTVLFIASLGFVWYYLHNARAISEERSRLQQLERELAEVDQQAIQARIDSMDAIAQKYSNGMTVVNSLLGGSNKWSKGLSGLAALTDSIQGVWVGSWSPMSDTQVQLAGHATARMRIVRFARQLDGDIRSVTFTEIRDWPLYQFTLTAPLDTTVPEATRYWRQERLAAMEGASASTPSLSFASRPPDTPTQGVSMQSAEPAPAPAHETPPPAQEDSPPAQSAASPAGDATPTEQSASPANASEPEAPESTQPAASANWTVVIAAPLDRAKADSTLEAYRDQITAKGHDIQIRQSPTNGRYLVSVGAFVRLSTAKATLKAMKDDLPEGSWLYEIPDEEPATASS
jgi:hypothetical protein